MEICCHGQYVGEGIGPRCPVCQPGYKPRDYSGSISKESLKIFRKRFRAELAKLRKSK